MLRRILRSLVAFATIVAAYQVYVLLAVPWMEPQITRKRQAPVTQDDYREGNRIVSRYQRLLSNYFPPDHWSQLRPPKVIAGSDEQAMLVLNDYERNEDGRVEIDQFALLVFPTPLRESESAPRDAIVLEAPQGAKLQFEEFRPERGEIGRITRGEFPGPITIRSDMREPGPDDDLLIETADLMMNTKLLYTTSPVRFRMGRNVGGGDEMELRFLDDEQGQSSDKRLKIAGVDVLEIRKNVRTRLYLGSVGLLPDSETKRSSATARAERPQGKSSGEGREESAPVEVTCSGPFHFDFVRYVAGFDRDVELRQLNANGPSDQLSAQQLDIHFAPREAASGGAEVVLVDPAKRQQRDLGRLEASTVVAQGHPVVVTSPARQAEARGGRVQLGLRDRRLVISDGSDVKLIYGSNVLQAPAIEYIHPPNEAESRIGRFRATGPGSLDYVIDPAKPEQVFRATWKTSVELGRHQGQPLLTLVGRPQMGVSKMGALEADRMQVFVREVAGDSPGAGGVPLPGDLGGDGKLQIVPDHLIANGRVEIESRQLTGNAEELLVEFHVEQPAIDNVSNSAAPIGAAGSPAGRTGPGAAQRFDLAQPSDADEAYHIDTEKLKIQVAVRGEQMVPTSLSCDRRVLFREIPQSATAEKPLEVRGERLTVDRLDSEMQVTIFGAAADGTGTGQVEPSVAQVAARGMTIEAATIELDERENRLWITGPGKAHMVASRDLAGRPSASSFPLDITWRGGLDFDGRQIVLDRDVLVQGADDWVRCDQLAARLTSPVKFGEHINQTAVDVAEIECRGQVMLDHRSRDELGLASYERMKLARLTINQQTGAISGDGPGEIRSTHFSTQKFGNAAKVANAVAPPPGVRGGKLHFLRVDFQRGLVGDLYQRELQFDGLVRTVYGPIDAWERELDGNRPEELPPESMTLNCDSLRLNEDPLAAHVATNLQEATERPLGPVQMRASGNVEMEGQLETQGRFGAEAESASYDQSKEVVILEGTARSPALLWQRRDPTDNSAPIYAQRLRYELSTGQISGRAQYLEHVPTAGPAAVRNPAPQRASGPSLVPR